MARAETDAEADAQIRRCARTAAGDAGDDGDGGSHDRVSSALACFEREMSNRAEAKVRASRDAAAAYHSPAACDPSGYGIEGVDESELAPLLAAMRERGVGASSGGELEARAIALHAELRAAASSATCAVASTSVCVA